MAKEESSYHQFNPTDFGGLLELPNYSADGADGWGIFQRDDTEGGIYVATNQVYSWKANSDVAVQQELPQKHRPVMRYLRHKPSPPNYTAVDGTVFSAADALTMTLYNGNQGRTLSQLLIYTPSNPPGLGAGKQWQWNLPNAYSDTKPYVDRVSSFMLTTP